MTELNAVISQKLEVAPGLVIFQVKPDGWDLPDFKGGQFVVLGVPVDYERVSLSDKEEVKPEVKNKDGLIKRAYSIASSSKEKEFVEFYITMIRSGDFTPRLFNLGVGDRIWMAKKFAGAITLDSVPSDANTIFLATGTGLAPHMSMLRSELACNEGRRFTVIHGASHSWDLGYMAELLTMERLCPNFTYIPVVSRPKEEHVEWKGLTGHLQDLWKSSAYKDKLDFTPSPKDTHFFLCGTPGMVDDFIKILENEKYTLDSKKTPGQVHADKWW